MIVNPSAGRPTAVDPTVAPTAAGTPEAVTEAAPAIRRPPGLRRGAGVAVVLAALAALAALVALSLSHGSNPIPAADVWAGLRARDATEASLIVWEERVPRLFWELSFPSTLGTPLSLSFWLYCTTIPGVCQ